MKERTTSVDDYLGLEVITELEDGYHEAFQQIIEKTLNTGRPTCKMFTITQKGNSVTKLTSLFLTILKVRGFIRAVHRDGRLTYTRVGVYPTLESPVVVFELDAPASAYVYDRVLPPSEKGMVGAIKNHIIRRTGVHPSIAALGILVRRS